ncbi:MAG: hypothetical protein ACFFER_14905, partial [Candidatus Thorarchaeota archaeon]
MKKLIRSLKSQALVAECPSCYSEFSLSDALLFDGAAPFPEEAKIRRREYENDLKTKRAELRKRKELASVRAIKTTESVSVG